MDFLQRTLDGWLDGSAYALVGIGLALTFGTLRRLNLAYGAGAMLAAYAGSWLFTRYDAPAWLVAPFVVGLAALIGLYVERLCFATGRDNLQDGATRGTMSGLGFTPARWSHWRPASPSGCSLNNWLSTCCRDT